MRALRKLGRTAFATLLCVSLLAWFVVPAVTHAPTGIEAVQKRAAAVAEHGHADGSEAELFWALHGHGQDAADHDHNPAVAALADDLEPSPDHSEAWRIRPSPGGPSRIFRIERPPRV